MGNSISAYGVGGIWSRIKIDIARSTRAERQHPGERKTQACSLRWGHDEKVKRRKSHSLILTYGIFTGVSQKHSAADQRKAKI